ALKIDKARFRIGRKRPCCAAARNPRHDGWPAGYTAHAPMASLEILRAGDGPVVRTISGYLNTENVGELCQLIEAEPRGSVVTMDLTDLILADREAVRLLRDRERDARVVLHNCPAYIRALIAAEED